MKQKSSIFYRPPSISAFTKKTKNYNSVDSHLATDIQLHIKRIVHFYIVNNSHA